MAPRRSPGSRDDPSRATEDRPGSWTPGWRPDSAPVRRSRPLAGTGNGIANRRVADATVGGGPARRPRTVPAIAVRPPRLACRAAARAAGCPGRRFRELRRARDPQGRGRGTAAESRRIGRFRRAGRTVRRTRSERFAGGLEILCLAFLPASPADPPGGSRGRSGRRSPGSRSASTHRPGQGAAEAHQQSVGREAEFRRRILAERLPERDGQIGRTA